jgi:hypothetical protein
MQIMTHARTTTKNNDFAPPEYNVSSKWADLVGGAGICVSHHREYSTRIFNANIQRFLAK